MIARKQPRILSFVFMRSCVEHERVNINQKCSRHVPNFINRRWPSSCFPYCIFKASLLFLTFSRSLSVLEILRVFRVLAVTVIISKEDLMWTLVSYYLNKDVCVCGPSLVTYGSFQRLHCSGRSNACHNASTRHTYLLPLHLPRYYTLPYVLHKIPLPTMQVQYHIQVM